MFVATKAALILFFQLVQWHGSEMVGVKLKLLL